MGRLMKAEGSLERAGVNHSGSQSYSNAFHIAGVYVWRFNREGGPLSQCRSREEEGRPYY